jgi:hypothetical protein
MPEPENKTAGPPAADPARRAEALAEINRLLEEDLPIGKEIAKIVHARDVRVRYHNQRMREDVEPFEKKRADLMARREKLRNAVLALWSEVFEGETTLKIPLGSVSRRRYRELTVRDKQKLLDALDHLDRLDVVDYTFDEKELLRLLDAGQLKVEDGAIAVRGHYGVQLKPKKGDGDAEDPPQDA